MGRHYEGSLILFSESRACSMSLQICIGFFAICGGSSIWWGLGCVRGVAVGGWLQSFVFEANPGFHVGWRHAGRVQYLFFSSFWLVLKKFSFWY